MGDSRKSGDCSSRSQTSEGLIIVPSTSSQSDDFNRFSQGNPENKKKSLIWTIQSLPLNRSNFWSANLSQSPNLVSVKLSSQYNEKDIK